MENGVVTVLHFLLHRKGVPKAIRLLGHPLFCYNELGGDYNGQTERWKKQILVKR